MLMKGYEYGPEVTGMILFKDESLPKDYGSIIEFKGAKDYVEVDMLGYYSYVDMKLDEGQVNELYEFLGRWIDVKDQT